MAVSPLYNLDLFNVNKMISEVNRELSRINPSNVNVLGRDNRLIWDEEVGTPVSQFFIDNISLKDAEVYHINMHLFTGSASNISLVLNKNTNAAEYHNVSLYTVNGAAALASSTNDAIIAPGGANDSIFIDGTISYSQNNKFTSFWFVYTETGEDFYYRNIHYLGNIPQEDITSIKIVSSVANAIGKDSHVRMWRAY